MDEILTQIKAANHIVVIAHRNPDADSLGSASALYSLALSLHKKVSFYCVTKHMNPHLSFIPWYEKVRDSFPSTADLAIASDCGTYERMGIEPECTLINIDHHQSNTNYGDYNLVDASAVSTTSLVYKLIEQSDVKINSKMATALYAGLIDDTDGFMKIGSDGMIFAIAQELIKHGAQHEIVVQNLMQSTSLGALRLKALMIDTMLLACEAQIAFFKITKEDMKRTGAKSVDAEAALEEALFLPTVEVSALIKENKDGSLKLSFRSSGKIDVENIASSFGGGGHQLRSGANLDAGHSMEVIKEKIITLLKKEM